MLRRPAELPLVLRPGQGCAADMSIPCTVVLGEDSHCTVTLLIEPGCPGPFHHYIFEFYALDTKLDLPATTSRDDLLKAMEGHVIGKAAYTGRFHATPQ